MNTPKQNETITLAALTGGVNTPSSRFRLRQYATRLEVLGIKVEEHIPYFEKSCGLPSPFKAAARIPGIIKSQKADVTWLGKELVKGYPSFERLLKRPRILDVDDAIWLSKPFGRYAAPYIAKSMDAIVAGNSYLADYFSVYCSNIHILPTAIDLDRYQPRPNLVTEPETFTIGWTGLKCNYKYLDEIAPTLAKFLDTHPRAKLLLLSNKPWSQITIPHGKIEFVKWTPQNETTTLHQMSVGLMPLTETKWAKGKCSFKMLQYMAAALPTIASPVGMNKDVLNTANIGFAATTDDQWYQALETLYNNWSLQKQLSQTARKTVEQNYNADKIATHLANIIKKTI